MSAPSTGSNGGNHPNSATRGGASAYPTPANNTGGGRGWGDHGMKAGGGHSPETIYHGHGEVQQSGNFPSLEELKGKDAEGIETEQNKSEVPEFANHKPGSQTLFQQAKEKYAI